MAGYISEFQYYGDTSLEFVEVALPAGTDPSGYQVHFYDVNGNTLYSFSLGTSTGTMGGQDVYVIDASTPGYVNGDATGRMYPDDAIALVNGSGTVEQFVSYWGNTVTAVDGPASGQTSTDVGTSAVGESLQSDDGGTTYYVQTSPNSGTIPACYAPGTLIKTPDGATPVDKLQPGDKVVTADGSTRVVRWIWRKRQPLDNIEPDQKPVLIRQGALGSALPVQDLIVSGQHRVVVGAFGQLENVFDTPQMVPAKSLTTLAGIRHMNGRRSITWYHFLCDDHSIVFANDLASETLLLGPLIIDTLTATQLTNLSVALLRPVASYCSACPVLPCLSVGQVRRALRGQMPGQTNAVFAHAEQQVRRRAASV